MKGAVLLSVLLAAVLVAPCSAQFVVSVNMSGLQSPFTHFWKHSVGSGHALLGTRSDWQAHLKQVKTDIGFERVRMHGIFDDDMSVVLGPGEYEFYNVDVVYDFLLSIGVRPIVELSFMPGVLANCWPWNTTAPAPNCQYVMHYDGIVQPPQRFADWRNLTNAFASHLVERYGRNEVRKWHFEVWNELWGMPYADDYLSLYEHAYQGIKAVDSELQIGGPATMQCQYVGEFVQDTGGAFDFVSTHLYPTDPNCSWPAPGYNDIDCFANTIKAARAKAPATKPFFMTEYNAGLFDAEMLYSSYAAAFVFRNLPQLHGVIDVWSYWTFTDIFEENGMHSAPFGGFNYGIQTVQGIKKPVYRAFEMLRDAGDFLLPVAVTTSVAPGNPNATVTAFATNSLHRGIVSVYISNFAPLLFPIQAEYVTVNLTSSVACTEAFMQTANVTLVDKDHGNPHQVFVELGSPAYPTKEEMDVLRRASEPARSVVFIDSMGNSCLINVQAQPYSAIRIDLVSLAN
jgi:xylan 1,4-beta-xylosidase